jgi:hypothetical protein
VRILEKKMLVFVSISLLEMHACPIETLLQIKHPPFAMPQNVKCKNMLSPISNFTIANY